MTPRRRQDDDAETPASQTYFEPDADEPVVAKPPSTGFVDSLRIFIDRADADPDGAITYVRQRAPGVRQAAQVANNMDSSTASKLAAYVDLLWSVTLEAVVGSMWSVDTDKRRARRLAGEAASCLDRCAVALQTPVDLNLARKALQDAESVF